MLTNRSYYLPLLCLGLPFVILYWLVPAFSSLTIGNDYGVFPIQHQLALMFSIEQGSFPLYVPGFAMGQSATALTLGQIYHPLPYLAALFPGYWEGEALSINTVIRLLSLGLCQWVMLHALQRLGLKAVMAFLLSFVCVYNLRMLDMFRYGSSLENYTAYLMMSAFIMLMLIERRPQYVLGLAFSSYLITVGGHPQMAYIGLLGAASLALMAPYLLPQLSKKVPAQGLPQVIQFWLWVLLATLVGIVLAAPYVLGFYFDFLPHNAIRTDNEYEWAIEYQDSWGGLFKSFYSPLSSNVHGAFGGPSLFMLVLLFPVLALLRGLKQMSVWVLFLVVILFFLVSAGDATPVHFWVWEYLPMASNFRVPGRFSLMLVVPLVLVLVWMVAKEESDTPLKRRLPFIQSPLALTCVLAAFSLLLLYFVLDGYFPEATWPRPEDINTADEQVMLLGVYLGVVVLGAAAAYFELNARQHGASAWMGGLLCVLVMVEAGHTLRYGTWVEDQKPQTTLSEYLSHLQQHYAVSAVPGAGLSMALVDEQIEFSILEKRLARYYRDVLIASSPEDMKTLLATERKPNSAVVLSEVPVLPVSGSHDFLSDAIDQIRLTEFHYNRLRFDVTSHADGLLALNLPFRQNWRVTVSGKPVDTYRANGYELAIVLAAGQHDVIFEYHSDETVIGTIISTGTVIIILVWLTLRSSSGRSKVALMALCLIPIAGAYAFVSSLYTGKALDVSYEWDSRQWPTSDNLAYGKYTRASSLYNSQMAYAFYPGLAVDGDRDGRAFRSAPSKRPFWKLDLGATQSVDEIIVYELSRNSLPVTVWVSNDDQNFKPITQIKSASGESVIRLEGKIPFRYLILSANKQPMLSFTEVEVIASPRSVP